MSHFYFSNTLVEKLSTARHVVALTGAGISAESGIATFRGADGIWKKLKPEELASMETFMCNPDLVWEWYEYRRKIIHNVTPNSGHYTLAKMEKYYPYFSISTQNVDGLHFRAGNKNVFELHGNILRNRCVVCGRKVNDVEFKKGEKIPRCECGGMIRPDVVWFGEMLTPEVLYASFEEAATADVYFSIGTSAVVYPAAMLPAEAKKNGAYVVEINLEPTPLSTQVDESFLGKVGEILPQLWQLVEMKNNQDCE